MELGDTPRKGLGNRLDITQYKTTQEASMNSVEDKKNWSHPKEAGFVHVVPVTGVDALGNGNGNLGVHAASTRGARDGSWALGGGTLRGARDCDGGGGLW